MSAARPLEFQRNIVTQATGCLTYTVLIPLAGLLIGLLTSGLVYAILKAALNVRDGVALACGYAAGALTWGWLGVWSYHEHRLRSGDKLRLYADRLEKITNEQSKVFHYAEIERLHVIKHAWRADKNRLFLVMRDAKKLILRATEWPLSNVVTALDDLATPVLVEHHRARLVRGETVNFPEPRRYALWLLGIALLCLFIGSFELTRTVNRFLQNRKIDLRSAASGFATLAGGMAIPFWQRVVRGRGIAVSIEGVQPCGSGDESRITWAEVGAVCVRGTGIRIEIAATLKSLYASTAVANYATLLTVLRMYLPDDIPWQQDRE